MILGLGFLLRLGWLMYARPVPVSDFAGYYSLAENLLDHGFFGFSEPSAYRLPGYPFFLAMMMLISRGVLWLSFTNVLLSTALIALIYAITWRLIPNQKVALIAAGIAAIYPIFVFFAPILASEHLFSLLFFSGLLVLLSPRLPGVLRAVLAGLAFGLAMLVRGEVIYYLPILALAIFFLFQRWSQRLSILVIMGACWLLVVFPWYLRNQAVIGPGSGMSTSGGLMFYYGHHDIRQWR